MVRGTATSLSIAKALQRALCRSNDDDLMAIAQFRTTLASEIEAKFSLSPLDPVGLPALCAALDPRSYGLGFLDRQEEKDSLKAEVLRRVQQLTSDKNVESVDCESEPPAKRQQDDDMFLFFSSSEDDQTPSCSSEVDQYFAQRPASPATDRLYYWKTNCEHFPGLAVLAKQIMCVPATSVQAERVFSAAGIIVNKLRAGLSHENVDALVFLHANAKLKAARSGILLRTLPQVASRQKRFEEEEADDLPSLPSL